MFEPGDLLLAVLVGPVVLVGARLLPGLEAALAALPHIKAIEPVTQRGQDLVPRAFPQFPADAVTGAILVALEQTDQRRGRGVGDLRRVEQGLAGVPHAPDAAMVVVAPLVAQRVLHVADQGVEPVDQVERAVRRELQVDGPEVDVRRVEEGLDLLRGEARILLDHAVLLDALKADRVVDQEVALGLVGKVARADDLAAGGRPDDLCEHLHPSSLRRVGRVAGDRGAEVVRAAGGVGDEVLAPAVEDVPPRIGEGVGNEDLELEALGLVAEDPGVDQAHRAVGGLDLAVVEGALLEVERAARTPGEGGDRVVAVLGAEAVEDDLVAVGHVVAVGVLDEHQIRLLRHVGAAVAEFEAGGQVQAACEDRVVIGAAVAVPVLEDDDLVVRFLVRQALRIGRHGRHPEPALGVECHGHRVADREVLLGSEQGDLVALGRVEVFQRVRGIERFVPRFAAAVRLLVGDFLGRGRAGNKSRG